MNKIIRKCDDCPIKNNEICPGMSNEVLCQGFISKNNKSSPNVLEKAINFSIATVKHVADGLIKVDENCYKERLNICKKCEHRSLNDNNPECLICGCPVKTKASWRSENCPIGKWPKKASSEPVEMPATPEATPIPSPPPIAPRASQGGCGCGK